MSQIKKFAFLNLDPILDFLNYSFPSKPNRICIDVTSRCNLECSFCEIGVGKSRDASKELTKNELFQIVDQLVDWGIHCIDVISGGEPFFREDIWEFLEYCISKRVRILCICTNGSLFSEFKQEQLSILSQSTQYLSISLDSTVSQAHDSFRGKGGSYDRLVVGIDKINAFKRSSGSPLLLHIATVVTKKNYDQIQPILSWAKEKSIDKVMFQPLNYMPNFYGVEVADKKRELLFASEEEMIKLKEEIIKSIKAGRKMRVKNNLSVFLQWALPYFKYALKQDNSKKYFFQEIYKDFKCFVPFSQLKINSQGGILPCYLLAPVNNIRNTMLKDAWHNNLKDVREHLKSGRFFSQCRSCYCDFPYSLRHGLPCYLFKGRLFFMNLLIYYFKRLVSYNAYRN